MNMIRNLFYGGITALALTAAACAGTGRDSVERLGGVDTNSTTETPYLIQYTGRCVSHKFEETITPISLITGKSTQSCKKITHSGGGAEVVGHCDGLESEMDDINPTREEDIKTCLGNQL